MYPPLTSSTPPSHNTTESTSTTDIPPNVKLQAGYVRLVRILPRLSIHSKAITECETCICASSMGVPYIALSYAWGNPHGVRLITVDGRRRMIADNLWQFLRQVTAKPAQPTCWLWIEALSIDQSDSEEKRHQVGITSSIFGRATAVIVWLGPALRDSNAAMQAISSSSFERPRTWGPLVDQAICELCERPYWKRLWVFQELKLAREVVLLCANVSLPWASFEACRGAISRLRFRMNSKIPARMIDMRTRQECVYTPLWSLLEATRDMLCKDPRDRAYALLSMATEGHEGIDVDYQPVNPSKNFYALMSALAHRILRNKHAFTPPTSLSAVANDCEFLDTVFCLH